MSRVERTIRIDAPPEKVFQFAADYLNWEAFFVGVSDVKPTTEKTWGDGTKFVYKATIMGIPMPVGTEIHSFVENEGWRGKSFKGVEHRTQWIFEPADTETEFTFAVDYKMPIPILGDILDKLIVKPEWEGIVEGSLQNLKGIMEA
jgi:carbon monoxide dehydrogenase subunit G